MQKINAALLSYGMSGRVFHAPFIGTLPGYHLYGVWERSKNLAVVDWPGVKTFRSLDKLLADEQVHLVIVNTPGYTHFEFAKAALLAGKHVVVEKPFVTTTAEAKELAALARDKNLVLSVFQNRRWDSDFQLVQQVVQEKLLGELIEAELHYDRYKEELSPKLHKETPGPGAGVVYDLGPHLVDQALTLFGMPHSLFADIRITRRNSLVPDCFDITLNYDLLRVRLHAAYLVREPLPAYILHGRQGSFLKARADVQEEALQNGQKPLGDSWGKEPVGTEGFLHTEYNGILRKERVAAPRGDYGQYYRLLERCIREGGSPPVTPEQGKYVIAVIEAAYTSADSGGVIKLI